MIHDELRLGHFLKVFITPLTFWVGNSTSLTLIINGEPTYCKIHYWWSTWQGFGSAFAICKM